ncbi:hypothetical protein BLS_004932 [Venturia inaequalis]|uniref:Uncharacterized protein n=1 Tax=Venturia inaequalis TaxID=5025 RepID=A0A8H3Z784_VENIN|nr:hypothetical protein EG328_006131 [Venturia inaequalis]KAE9983097.1 hypothetical protein BLS_004932 [Venturia inaequalis]KAE9989325.1 hypothetical protein EG327_002841 [Venturia inaequalis]RDI85904.1 hypothetical protein Vi05172_g4124 [Venturia inaequalis]
MSSLPSKFHHDLNSLSIFPRACRISSPSIHISLAKPNLREYQSSSENSTCAGKSLTGNQEGSDEHTEYDRIFDNFVHSEDANDGKQSKRKNILPELRNEEDVDRLACVFEMELTTATPMSASCQLSYPPWPLEALGIRGASCDPEALDHFSCGATDCGYGSCDPPTPGEYVFTPLPEDPMSSVVSDPASASPISTSIHLGSPISTLKLDSPTLGWTHGSPDLEKTPSHKALDPIFTHFNIGGLPSPDETPTGDDCLSSSFPLFETKLGLPAPKPTTPLSKRSRTDSCITDAPKKRSRMRTDGESSTKKRRKS